jgi:nucleoside-diphosphate kinase
MHDTPKNEYTLVVIKPDGIKKSITGNILSKLAEARLMIIGAKVAQVSRELAENHYRHLKDQPFFNDVIEYIQGKSYGKDYQRVIAFVYQGPEAIARVRRIAGATNPEEADPVSIRGSYGRITTRGIYENVIHASSDPKEAEREIKLWFKPGEIIGNIYPTQKIKAEPQEELVWA